MFFYCLQKQVQNFTYTFSVVLKMPIYESIQLAAYRHQLDVLVYFANTY